VPPQGLLSRRDTTQNEKKIHHHYISHQAEGSRGNFMLSIALLRFFLLQCCLTQATSSTWHFAWPHSCSYSGLVCPWELCGCGIMHEGLKICLCILRILEKVVEQFSVCPTACTSHDVHT